MAKTDYNAIFPEHLLHLTNEERRYLALDALEPGWKAVSFYSNTGGWYGWVEAYFDGDTIVKVIQENRSFLRDGSPTYRKYTELDTHLQTRDGMLLPLTGRGKPKKLTASAIMAVTALRCSFSFIMDRRHSGTEIYLTNPRANRRFPLGEQQRIARITDEAGFHEFMDWYMSTCPEDYFDRVEAFRRAQKVTVRYRSGDIFRMELDRTRFRYGIITGTVRQLRAMPELPEKHSLRRLMMVPILVRFYQLTTTDPSLTAAELENIPLGTVDYYGDNDIIWGTHPIVDHKQIGPELQFPLVCTQEWIADPVRRMERPVWVEWGFARTCLERSAMTPELREFFDGYHSTHGGVHIGIVPEYAIAAERPELPEFRNDLLSEGNRQIREKLFDCLRLGPDADFDTFARAFGGLSSAQILERMIE